MSEPVIESPEAAVEEPAPVEPAKAEVDWQAEARKWERRAKDNRAQLDKAGPKLSEYDRLVAASQSDLERAQGAAQQAEAKVQQITTRAVAAEVKAAAADLFADPSDAAAFLALDGYVSDDGEIDTGRIAADLTDLLQRKPHLAKAPQTRLPAPNPALGASASGPAEVSQMSREEVERLAREGKHDEINAAREAGRLNSLLGINK